MLELSVRILLGAGLNAGLASTALADDGSSGPRWPTIEIVPESTKIANPRQFLTLIDGRSGDGAVSRGKSRVVPFAAADIGLTFELARLSSKLRPLVDSELDSYSLRQLHIRGRLPVQGDLEFMLTGDAAHMARRIASVPASLSNGRVLAASAGLGIARDDFSVTVRYETVGTKVHSGPTHRMAEILGGAPVNREAVALLVADGSDLGRGVRMNYRLGARLARRTRDDLQIIGASADNRTEEAGVLELALAF